MQKLSCILQQHIHKKGTKLGLKPEGRRKPTILKKKKKVRIVWLKVAITFFNSVAETSFHIFVSIALNKQTKK